MPGSQRTGSYSRVHRESRAGAQIRLPYAADSDEARAKLEYDLYYVMHRTLWFDLAVLLETARVVLTGAGAR